MGIMALFVWLGTGIVRRVPPTSGVVWTANESQEFKEALSVE